MVNKQTKQIISFGFRIQNSPHFYSLFKFLLTWIIVNIFSLEKKSKCYLYKSTYLPFLLPLSTHIAMSCWVLYPLHEWPASHPSLPSWSHPNLLNTEFWAATTQFKRHFLIPWQLILWLFSSPHFMHASNTACHTAFFLGEFLLIFDELWASWRQGNVLLP